MLTYTFFDATDPQLNRDGYNSAVRNFLVELEGLELAPYLDGKLIPTIGIGFNLHSRWRDICRRKGRLGREIFRLNRSERQHLDSNQSKSISMTEPSAITPEDKQGHHVKSTGVLARLVAALSIVASVVPCTSIAGGGQGLPATNYLETIWARKGSEVVCESLRISLGPSRELEACNSPQNCTIALERIIDRSPKHAVGWQSIDAGEHPELAIALLQHLYSSEEDARARGAEYAHRYRNNSEKLAAAGKISYAIAGLDVDGNGTKERFLRIDMTDCEDMSPGLPTCLSAKFPVDQELNVLYGAMWRGEENINALYQEKRLLWARWSKSTLRHSDAGAVEPSPEVRQSSEGLYLSVKHSLAPGDRAFSPDHELCVFQRRG